VANLSPDQLRVLARLGAEVRVQELRQEEAAIRAMFPDLFGGGRQARDAGEDGAAPATTRRRRRQKMSPAARKAVSERMRRYWAERRKARPAS
jgi:hypothetical protein